MTEYTVLIEETPNNYCADVPDLPGCVAVGDTWDEVMEQIREAIIFHIEGLSEDGEVPRPSARAVKVDVGDVDLIIENHRGQAVGVEVKVHRSNPVRLCLHIFKLHWLKPPLLDRVHKTQGGRWAKEQGVSDKTASRQP